MVGVIAAAAIPMTSLLGPMTSDRVVGRDVIESPVGARQYPSLLSNYRRYSKDLGDESLIHMSNLPKGARARLDVMNAYDGTTFGISASNMADGTVGYRRVGSTIPGRSADTTSVQISVSISRLLGSWVPTIGQMSVLRFEPSAPDAAE